MPVDANRFSIVEAGGRGLAPSGENRRNEVAVDVGQPEMPALVFERQLFVIDPQQMQHRCLEIVDMDSAFGDVVTKRVRCSNVIPGRTPPPAIHMEKQRG